MSRVRPARAPRWRRTAVAALLATTVVVTGPGVGAQDEPVDETTTTTTTAPRSTDERDPGRIAYVTPEGEVVVADSDGTNAITVGSGAVANDEGLAPLAWRQPGADAVTFVRDDGALVVAPIDGGEPLILATDAVVPPDSDEAILSWDLTGNFLIYLAEPVAGRIESRVIDLSTADDDNPPQVRTIGNPDRRRVIAQMFSPIDPIIFQKTADIDTGRRLTVAIVEPIAGTIIGSNLSVDDVTFGPDGRYAFAITRVADGVEQLVRMALRQVKGIQLMSDHERVCNPAVSPDATMVVFAAGKQCQEIWTIRYNGTQPKRIVKRVAKGATFAAGAFTWSGDGKVISHAACTQGDGTTATGEPTTECRGGYWDISVDGKQVRSRAVAGSVQREPRALLRSVKIQIDIDGPIEYSGRMQLGSQSRSVPFQSTPDDKIDAKAVDENNSARSFEIKGIHPVSSVLMGGTLRVIDGEFDETFTFFGRVQPFSLGYAKFRGIWTRSERLPMQSGQITITVER